MADHYWDNGTRVQLAPTIDREPQRSRGSSDRREQPLQDKMNKTAPLGGYGAAPSSPASAATRIRATESLFTETSNTFATKSAKSGHNAVQQISAGLSRYRRFRAGVP